MNTNTSQQEKAELIQKAAKEQLIELGVKLGYSSGWSKSGNCINTYANSLYLYKCGFYLENIKSGWIADLYWETNAPTSGNQNSGFAAVWMENGKLVTSPFFETTEQLHNAIKSRLVIN